jgi:hypothetical protein
LQALGPHWTIPELLDFIDFASGKDSEERHAGKFRELARELVLKRRITCALGRGLWSSVMPISTTRRGSRIIAYGKPCLSEIPLVEIVWRARPAHLRRNPPRIDGVAQHVGPPPCDRERQCSQIQLAV